MNIMNNSNFTIYPIGVVHSSISDTKEMPKEGISNVKIEIFQEYVAGINGLEQFSHIYLVCFFHESSRDLLVLDKNRGHFKYLNSENAPTGVFSSRSPSRINPLAITVVQLVSIENNILEVNQCDAIDGTPVIDIKTYTGGNDYFMNLRAPMRILKNPQKQIERIQRIIKNTSGVENELTALISRIYCDVQNRGINYKSRDVKICVPNIPELIDSAIFLSTASLSSRRISIIPENKFCITFETPEQKLKYTLRKPALNTSINDILYGEVFNDLINIEVA